LPRLEAVLASEAWIDVIRSEEFCRRFWAPDLSAGRFSGPSLPEHLPFAVITEAERLEASPPIALESVRRPSVCDEHSDDPRIVDPVVFLPIPDSERQESQMPEQLARVLIWAKTYPELSTKHVETVCTGGVLEDGRPVRLYPVPLRYLSDGGQYKLFDWIDVPLRKSTKDPRPESFRIDANRIKIVGSIGTTSGWRERRALVFRHQAWQFPSLVALKLARTQNLASMGVVTPASVLGAEVRPKNASARLEHEQRLKQIQSQGDLFRPSYKKLEFLPNTLWLAWRCGASDCSCAATPHQHRVLDWGLLELARRDGWEKAKTRLESITDTKAYELRLFMGNYFRHQQHFAVIGLWYPKLKYVTPEEPSFL
jgi:hypothetical protein